MSENSSTFKGRLRRLNLAMMIPPLGTVGVILVATDSQSWWEACVLGLGLVTTVLVLQRWAADDLTGIALPGLILTAALWPFGALVSDSHTAFYGLATVGAIVVTRVGRHRKAAMIGLVLYVFVVGMAALWASADESREILIRYVIVPTGITAMSIGATYITNLFFGLFKELEQAQEREAELAVARERVRFAGDLHDIQGHTLHVVKLKAKLAQKLIRQDTARAESELVEIHKLITDTITQTRELAYAQRRLNLTAEIENAKNLLEAVGICVDIDSEGNTDPYASELLGQVLRETTTNILRHARATHVEITLTSTGLTITNDGAKEGSSSNLRGLHTLKQRLAIEGGKLTVEQHEDRFTTTAELRGIRSTTTR